MKNVLVVEDDPITRKILCATIEKYGFSTITAVYGSDALFQLKERDFHAIILDLKLPDMNGLEILRHIRNSPSHSSLAAIIVTENNDKLEAVLGLEMGADDYITKPFHQRELIARLNTVLRRTDLAAVNPNPSMVYDDLEIDMKARLVKKGGKAVDFSFKEFEILALLASNPGEVLSRDAILNSIGSIEYSPESRAVDMHISSIRKKLGDTGVIQKYIDTVSNVGYRFRKY